MSVTEPLDEVWSAQDTTPADVDAALRGLLTDRHATDQAYAPARVLNLVVIVDREWRGEILNRLARVGRYHPSRTIVCAVQERRTTLDAWATMACDLPPGPGGLALCREQVMLDIGLEHCAHLDTIVSPILVSDLATVVWSPHGHAEAVDSLLGLTDVVLLDSVDEPDLHAALDRVSHLAGHAYVVDLAWLRSTPWRERISATFDPPALRPGLAQISVVEVRHRADSAVAALLLVGWLGSRLGWTPGPLVSADGGMRGRARARRQEVQVRLHADAGLDVPGLAGVTIETASGTSISLERGTGGLRAVRRTRDACSEWTLLGASRGEGGILGEGVRQALLRDPTYRPALETARQMLP
jgi:glucose-6-phosphate dehydrogenase assembly protein OpcA